MAQLNKELKQYLLSKRWSWKPAGKDNVSVRVCPFCGNSNSKFTINIDNTKFQCWVCKESGNLYKLKKHMGDIGATRGVVNAADAEAGRELETKKKYRTIKMSNVARWHAALLENSAALDYCTKKRKLSMEAVIHFKLGYRRKHGKEWIVIPHIIDGVCKNVKMRHLADDEAEKAFCRTEGCESVLFNADCLEEYEEIYLTEAEIDAISLWSIGIRNVVSVTAGAGKLMPEWYDMLADKQRIVLVQDNDTPGQCGAREFARRLGFDRCENVQLPLNDVNEVLTDMGPDELRRAVAVTKMFEVDGILTVSESIKMSIQEQEFGEEGILTPWHMLNRIIRPGWHPGDLVVLSARPKIGKTTMALNLCFDLSVDKKLPTYFFCLEMRPSRLANKIAQIVCKKSDLEMDIVDKKLAIHHLKHAPLYFHDPSWNKDSVNPEGVCNKIREVVKRYGIKLVVFDHLHFLCRSLSKQIEEQQQVMKAFKLLAEELQIVLVLIAQPRKSKERYITADDLLGSQSIHSDADHVLILHRDRVQGGDDATEEEMEREVLDPKMRIRVESTRFGGGGDTYVYYIGEQSRIVDIEDAPIRKLK